MGLTEEIENNGGIWALEQKIDQPMDEEAGSTVLLFFLGEQGTGTTANITHYIFNRSKGKKVIDEDPDLEEDEQLAMAIQESLNINMNSPPRNNHGSMFPRLPSFFPSVYKICAGCNGEIGHGRFLSCMGGVWHPECFRCHACNIPISDYEVQLYSNSLTSFPCLTTVRSTNHAIKNILTQNAMFAITFKDVGLVKELMDDCLTSQLSNSLRLHDVVSALGPMYEGHDNIGCKKLQSQINHLEGTKDVHPQFSP
ncbi:unnamed protein product [Lactuca saligna]|uniref:LIM zinc-binding domain-containing protein n=1 Tax=Lactuca saligna TaxID=75948 RepID=A0AA35VD45_LACSI|nr:unnamed protein product [Lactuca saligna]